MSHDLKEFVKLIVEQKIREVDVTSGKALMGSDEHISDLEMRIASLLPWRDKSPRGSETRANYSRLISRLRAELMSAKKKAERQSALRNEDV